MTTSCFGQQDRPLGTRIFSALKVLTSSLSELFYAFFEKNFNFSKYVKYEHWLNKKVKRGKIKENATGIGDFFAHMEIWCKILNLFRLLIIFQFQIGPRQIFSTT